MTMPSIGAVERIDLSPAAPGGAAQAQAPAAEAGGAAAAAPSFASWMVGELSQTNTHLMTSERGLQRLAAGDSVSLHEVMMRAEEARLSLALMAQVRNRLVEAYQDILRMQG